MLLGISGEITFTSFVDGVPMTIELLNDGFYINKICRTKNSRPITSDVKNS